MLRLASLFALGTLLLTQACGEVTEFDPPPGTHELQRDGGPRLKPAAAPAPGTVVHRVNAGGAAIAAANGGPAWGQDTSGSPSAYGNAAAAVSQVYSTSEAINVSDASIPAGTPAALFQTERWDSTSGAEMLWRFPVEPGVYEVRLYLAEIYSGAYAAGARKFDVYAEGQLKLNDLDVYALAGAKKGIVKRISVTADASLDVEFRHVSQNPAIKAIEIVYTGSTASTPQQRYRLNAGGASLAMSDGGPNWSADTPGAPSSLCNGYQTGNYTYATVNAINLADASVPAGTPQSLFQSERYDVLSAPDLQCNFAVEPGSYEVRLYFAETYSGAMRTGARVFDVYVEGALKFDNLDVYAAVGGYKGLVKKTVVTADSVLTVRLAAVTQNPALKGIEILPSGTSSPPPPPPPSGSGVRLNHFQVKATHNSYHLRPDVYDSPTWEYDMPTLTNQLNLYGVRGFELDLHWGENQFLVYHWGVDPKSTCPYFRQCLAELSQWSAAHPDHMPLFVFINPKYDTEGDNVFNHLEEIDQYIDAAFPRSRIYAPDDFTGGAGQVQDVMKSRGWPDIGAARGKVMFVLLSSDEVGKRYANHGTGLQGKRMWVASGNTAQAWVAIAMFDDTAKAANAVKAGFIVRTRADEEPGLGEISMTRFNRTLATGAHLVTTDYPVPYTVPGYDTTIPGGTPARCNPVTAGSTCTSGAIE